MTESLGPSSQEGSPRELKNAASQNQSPISQAPETEEHDAPQSPPAEPQPVPIPTPTPVTPPVEAQTENQDTIPSSAISAPKVAPTPPAEAAKGDTPDITKEKPKAAENSTSSDNEKPVVTAPPAKGGRRDKNASTEPAGPSVVARYGRMRHIGEFRYNNLKALPLPGQHVVVRSDRGVEMAVVINPVHRGEQEPISCRSLHGEQVNAFLKKEGADYPFRRNGRVLRVANSQDMIDYRHLKHSAKEAEHYCSEQIQERKLDMQLVAVEHLLGGDRIIFYFTAEHRVDFRDLVRDLASRFRTRIEMRQVGARDEARLVADYERCGQRCCCQQFLQHLKPISMRMAKVQKATLDPSKISGRCGRLMCCLRYEDEGYEELRKKLPKRNTWVRTEKGFGRVLDTQILTQLVKLYLADGRVEAVPNDEILERNLPEPSEEEILSDRQTRREEARKNAEEAAVSPFANSNGRNAESGESSPEKQPQEKQNSSRRRRRRPRGKKPAQGEPKNQNQKQNQQQADGGDGKSRSKRRRRRRPRGGKKRSGGGETPNANTGGGGTEK